ncbi:MAG TPA: hypothetical protein VFO06_06020 [Gemmatimonadales bacterium]|nr:hypothetical protein [Gemmatimonadales bacterium]
MKRSTSGALAGATVLGLLLASAGTATAQRQASTMRMHPDTSATTPHAPPGGAYQKVSALVPLPDFIPGLGTLYVDPATLPAGPFLGYDRQRNLVNSIYMIPLKDLNAQKAFSGLKVAQERVDHVDIVFNAGHPGVAEPHYHVTLWYVPPERVAELTK